MANQVAAEPNDALATARNIIGIRQLHDTEALRAAGFGDQDAIQ